jgi:hypothetical protein
MLSSSTMLGIQKIRNIPQVTMNTLSTFIMKTAVGAILDRDPICLNPCFVTKHTPMFPIMR